MNKLKVRVHLAYFVDNPHAYYFINVRNNHKRRYIKITRVFFIKENHTIDVTGYERRTLPVLIPPQKEWETWISRNDIGENVLQPMLHFIVETESGKFFASRIRRGVAPKGEVPNGK